MAETRKTVTIVLADVTGSTARGERTDPEVMRRIMERYFEEMHAVLEKHGGTRRTPSPAVSVYFNADAFGLRPVGAPPPPRSAITRAARRPSNRLGRAS